MKKTKIICTIGPTSDKYDVLKKLALNGMDIARFNFSHGSHEEQKKKMDLLKEVRDDIRRPIAILLDTKGPEIRTGILKDGQKVTLEEDQEFVLTTEEIEGNAQRVSITYDGLAEDVEPGKKILIDDGLIELEVKAIQGADIVCTVINGGELGQRKGVNVPNVPVRLPAITEKDKEDIIFGMHQGVDFIAASFVRNADAIREIKALLKEHDSRYIPIIAKIENEEGIRNIDEILEVADGIMVARGDLGVEIPAYELPHLQKMLIQKCNDALKPVITATQMLDSMMRNPRPTRAEVTDVANAVYDGTDAVMLSGETANGKYPLEALKMMVKIVEDAESHLNYKDIVNKIKGQRHKSISNTISYATVTSAMRLNAKCIIVPTSSGSTARVVSKFKPSCTIVGVSPNAETLRRMQIFRGVVPVKSVPCVTTEEICREAICIAKLNELISIGDIAVVTAGIPSTTLGADGESLSNMKRIVVVE